MSKIKPTHPQLVQKYTVLSSEITPRTICKGLLEEDLIRCTDRMKHCVSKKKNCSCLQYARENLEKKHSHFVISGNGSKFSWKW